MLQPGRMATGERDGRPEDGGLDGDEDSHSDPSSSSKKRKHFTRIRSACERCKLRKQKCDLLQPRCSNCIRGDAQCIAAAGVVRSAWAEHDQTSRSQLEQRLLELEQRLEQFTSTSSLPSVPPLPLAPSAPSVSSQSAPSHTAAIADNGTNSSSSTADRRWAETTRSSELLHHHLRYATPHVRDLGHMSNGTRQASSPLDLFATVACGSSRPLLPRPVRPIPLPSVGETDRLVSAFFANRWPNYPIFYRSAFVADVVHSNPMARSDTTSFFLYMVLSIASIDTQILSEQDRAFAATSFDYYTTATTFYLEGTLAADELGSIQGLLLLAMFAMSDPRGISLWHVTGIISRMCIDYGLHRITSENVIPSAKEELQRRVFWCAFALERSVAVALGRRPCLAVDDITTPLPTPIDDLVLSPITNTTASPPDIAAFIHTLRLRGLNGLIQSKLYGPTSEPTLSSCSEKPAFTLEGAEEWRRWMRQRLDAWLRDAPTYPLPYSSTYKTKDWFLIAHSHSLLILFRPSSSHPQLSQDSMQICADASMTLISAYFRLYTFARVTYTWVALHSLYLATITALYTLQRSEQLRRTTSHDVVQMHGCSTLLAAMSQQWPAARHCQRVVDELTQQTLEMFRKDASSARAAALATFDRGSNYPGPGMLPPISPGVSLGEEQVHAVLEADNNHFMDIRPDLDAWLDSLVSTGAGLIDAPIFGQPPAQRNTIEQSTSLLDAQTANMPYHFSPAYPPDVFGVDGGTELSGTVLDSLLWMQTPDAA